MRRGQYGRSESGLFGYNNFTRMSAEYKTRELHNALFVE